MNLSGRGVRTTVGVPGTGLSYTTSSGRSSVGRTSSGRRPSLRQLEAAARRAEIDAWRAAALAEAQNEESDLEDRLGTWRHVPELPERAAYERATRPAGFVFDEPAPPPLDGDALHREFLLRIRQSVRAGGGASAGTALLGMVAVLASAGTLIAGTALYALWFGVLASTLAAVPLAGAAFVWGGRWSAQARAQREIALLERPSEWTPYWRQVQADHLRAVHEWEERRDAELAAAEYDDRQRRARAERIVNGDPIALEEAIGWALAELDVPFEALSKVIVPDSGTVYVLLDLPELEDVMPETRTKVLKDGTPKEVKRPKGERLTAYGSLVCGLGLLVARTALAAGPTIGIVHVAAYTQRRQKRTDSIADDFVYDVAISRETSAALDHASVDPVAVVSRLQGRMKLAASGDLGKIEAPDWLELEPE